MTDRQKGERSQESRLDLGTLGWFLCVVLSLRLREGPIDLETLRLLVLVFLEP